MSHHHHPTPWRRALLVLVAAISVLLVSGAPVLAQDGTTTTEGQPGAGLPPTKTPPSGEGEKEAGWAVQPAGPDGPGLRSAFTYNVKPGQTLRDSVSISNLSSKPITFAVYPKDAFNTEGDGAFALDADEDTSDDVGSWVTIKVDEYTVPSGKRADIPFEVKVPEDASPGDHAGGIIAANVEPVETVDQSGVALSVRQRVAARIYIRVAGPLTPELRVKNVQVTKTTPVIPFVDGKVKITYTLENLGNVRLESATETEVTGLFGRTVKTLKSQDLPELLPGGSVQVTETFKGTPPIEPLTAHVKVKSLDTSVTETASKGFFVWSWLVVILLVLLAAVLAFRAWRKRRRAKRAEGAGGTAGPDGPLGEGPEDPADAASTPDPAPEPVGVGGDGGDGPAGEAS
jgi:hypothetical protein